MTRLEDYEVSEVKLKQVVSAIRHRRMPVATLQPFVFLGKLAGLAVDFDDWSTLPRVPYSRDLSAHIRAGLGMELFHENIEGIGTSDVSAKKERDILFKPLWVRIYQIIWHQTGGKTLTAEDHQSILGLSAGMLYCLTKGICGPDMVQLLQERNRSGCANHWERARHLLLTLLRKEIGLIPLSAEGKVVSNA